MRAKSAWLQSVSRIGRRPVISVIGAGFILGSVCSPSMGAEEQRGALGGICQTNPEACAPRPSPVVPTTVHVGEHQAVKTISDALGTVTKNGKGAIWVESGKYAEALKITFPVTIAADEKSAGQVVLTSPAAGGCIDVDVKGNKPAHQNDVLLKELTINSCITTANASLTLDDVVMNVGKGTAISVISGELNLGGKPTATNKAEPVPTSVRITGSGMGDNDGVVSNDLNAIVNVQNTVLSGFKSALNLNSSANLGSGTKIVSSVIGLEIQGAPRNAEIFKEVRHPDIEISDVRFENNSTGIKVDSDVLLQKLEIRDKTTIVHYVPQTSEANSQPIPPYAYGILIGKPVATSAHPAFEIVIDNAAIGRLDPDLTANPGIEVGVGIESETPLTISNTVLNGNASGIVLGGPALEMPGQVVRDYSLDGVSFKYNSEQSVGLEIKSSIPRTLSIINTTWQKTNRNNEFVAAKGVTVQKCDFKDDEQKKVMCHLSEDSRDAIEHACGFDPCD